MSGSRQGKKICGSIWGWNADRWYFDEMHEMIQVLKLVSKLSIHVGIDVDGLSHLFIYFFFLWICICAEAGSEPRERSETFLYTFQSITRVVFILADACMRAVMNMHLVLLKPFRLTKMHTPNWVQPILLSPSRPSALTPNNVNKYLQFDKSNRWKAYIHQIDRVEFSIQETP